MANDTQELIRKMTQETLRAGFFLWAALYLLDLAKPGFASNYISLPQLAALLFVLAIVVASLQPLQPAQGVEPSLSISWLTMAVVAALVAASLLAAGVSLWLTLALAFVTLFSLWALRFGWKDTL